MKETINNCQFIMNVLDRLETEAVKEGKGKINPALTYGLSKIRNQITSRILSKEVGYLQCFKNHVEYDKKIVELTKKFTSEVKKKDKDKKEIIEYVIDEEALKKDVEVLEKENEEMLKEYAAFQEREIDFNGNFYKIKLSSLPKEISKYISDILVEFDLVME